MKNFFYTWLAPNHSLFFVKQYWYRFWYNRYFNNIEKFPLTTKQRQAIIVDEHRNLVIAGAGTGKTSTVVGKVGFLTKTKKAKPSEILVIAYNRNAAAELKERIEKTIKVEVEVGTFHSIGKSILKESRFPNRPHPFVDQEEKLLNFLDVILKRCLKLGDFSEHYFEYFKKYEFRNVDEVRDFKSEREYANWLRSNKLITLNAETVKSHGELLIANFLYANGIDYQYEAFYSPKNEMPVDFDYRPDFFLPDYNVYIEYFGVDADGNTAVFIPKQKYHDDMKWKFETHRLGNTNLVDVYFHQKRSGNLLKILEEKLENMNVNFSQRPESDLFKVINETQKDKRFLKLVERFLSQYKERQNSVNLNNLVEQTKTDKRTQLFLKIFGILLNAYNTELSKVKNIDFGDMISMAAKLVREKKVRSPYKYIIIDEFQDISDGRYDLVLQLLNQNGSTKLFAVGDDWQAIYRFAGSDHKIMTNFNSLFGNSTTLKLDLTFRYNNQIALVSEKFITKNPSQLSKNLKTLSEKLEPQIFVHWHSDDHLDAIKTAIASIRKGYQIEDQTLFLLSRYNHNKLETSELKQVSEIWGNGTISQRSIHSSKGLEADFVIITDVKSDHFGFPSEIQDDPILNLILSIQDDFEDSEERRLFYVAITRAKHQTHLISDATCPSRFSQELTDGNYPVVVTGDKTVRKKCPSCSDGVLIKKNGRYGDYYACYNYPVCNFKPLVCTRCKSDIVLREKSTDGREVAICQSENCAEIHITCKKCAVGVYREVQGKTNPFLGCHDFPRTRCRGTEQLKAKVKVTSLERWTKTFETSLSSFSFSDNVKLSCDIKPYPSENNIEIKISILDKKQQKPLLELKVDLEKFFIEINDSKTLVGASVLFEDDRTALAIIENEIIQRLKLS